MLSCLHRNNPNRPRRQQDSGWSYLVLACATFCQAVSMGILDSFGVLFPVIIRSFNSSRQETGKLFLIEFSKQEILMLATVDGSTGIM